MRDVLITGNLAYVPANHRIDTDRLAAGHAERYAAFDRAAFLGAMAATGHEQSAVTVSEGCHSDAASISSGHSPATVERP